MTMAQPAQAGDDDDPGPATKVCRDCAQVLPLSAFYSYDDKRRPGSRYTCPACRTCTVKQQIERRKANWGSAEAARKATIYGLSVHAHAALHQLQAGLCAICRLRPCEVVDHDHGSRRVRGLLCQRCNSALGALGDDLAGVQKLLDYLIDAQALSIPAPDPLARRKRDPLHQPPPAEELRQLRLQGLSLQRIAVRYGVSLDTAGRWVRSLVPTDS